MNQNLIENQTLRIFVERIRITYNQNQPEQIADIQKEIDQLIYRLYDLTDEEIGIVEGKVE